MCDCTGSMSSYLASAQENIKKIIEEIVAGEKSDVQFCLIQYRDHPPQEETFAVKSSPWTSSISKMKSFVDEMSAQGGGDGPESVVDALWAARNLDYRKGSVRVAVLIADAPPHGLGENGDGFPNGCPCGHDPIQVVKEMASLSIVIYSVAVEPGLGGFKTGRDFMRAIAKMTDGQFLPLTNAKLLPKVIAGGAAEELSLNKVAEEVEKEIEVLKAANPALEEEELIAQATTSLQKKGITTKQLAVEDIYTSAWDMRNVDKMAAATSLSEVRGKLDLAANAHVGIQSKYSEAPSYSSYAPAPASSYRSAAPRGGPVPSRSRAAAYEAEEEALGSPHMSFASAPAAPVQAADYSASTISYEQVARLSSRSKKK